MNRGDVYLVKFKEPDKKRPALILTRTEAIPSLNAVTVVPVTGTIRDVRSQVILDEGDGMEKECVINVDNIQTVSQQKIGAFVTQLSEARMSEVFEAVKFAFGFDK
jgi:mRNA interferase MazF